MHAGDGFGRRLGSGRERRGSGAGRGGFGLFDFVGRLDGRLGIPAGGGPAVDVMKADAFAAGGFIQPHGDGDHPEGQASSP